MLSSERSLSSGLKALVATGLMAGVLAACHGNLLDVKDPDVVTPTQLSGPGAVAPVNAGVIGDFREMMDNYVRYTGLMTDEFLLAGTFPTRREVDDRQINVDNATLTDEMYTPLQVTVVSADRAAQQLGNALSDPDFADILSSVQTGLTRAQLFGGYDRLLFAEAYCQSIFSNPVVESAPVLPKDRASEALALLQKAESSANTAGLSAEATAAAIGQARAQMFLGNYQAAAQAVSSVPTDFTYEVAYSANTTAEENEVYQLTWGDKQALRWTVGNGDDAARYHEAWPYFDEWVQQGLLIPNSQHGLTAFGAPTRTVTLQTEYGGTDPSPDAAAANRSGAGATAPIVLASGWEAQMIQAEAELRGGQTAAAQDRVNALLKESDQADNPVKKVNPAVPFAAFDTVAFNGTLSHDLTELARARAAGMWLQGQRQGYFRRLFLNDNVDLYPQNKPGTDIAFPVVKQELDNNSNISSGCPSGQPWR
ncbi:MAG TPA: hypothetical protein VKA64_00060 [Gammaproteobacteria bacterium]|nr:hypothetical protein [Gammaproteobacteria bacterium]